MNQVILINVVLIVIGSLGMLISFIVGIYIYRKEDIYEYFLSDLIKNHSKKKRMAKMINVYQSVNMTGSQGLRKSDKLSDILEKMDKSEIETEQCDGEQTEYINVNYDFSDKEYSHKSS